MFGGVLENLNGLLFQTNFSKLPKILVVINQIPLKEKSILLTRLKKWVMMQIISGNILEDRKAL